MIQCERVVRKCEKCDRYVKTPPRSCLSLNEYQSCHKLCKPCWHKYWGDNYERDEELQKKYVHCIYCTQQRCCQCGGFGTWHSDIRKVLCYECL